MAHRIAKKQQQARHQTETTHKEQEVSPQYYANQQSQSQPVSKLPRPLLPSVSTVLTHDKFAYRQGKPAFPLPQSSFLSSSNYDASPYFIRPSSAYIFGNARKSAFPYGVWVMPFGSDQVHKVRVNSPLRCTRCKAYVNAYFRFDGTKTNVACNICGINFGVDHSHTDANNFNSTEIATEGVIDFVVKDSVFIKKRVDIVKIVMAFQINNFMVQSNAFNTIIQSTKAAISNTQYQKNIRIGFLLFNGQSIIYPKLPKSKPLKPPTKYTTKYSPQGLCCPLSDEQFLFNPNTQKQQILYLLDCITDIVQQQHKNSKYTTQGANYVGVIKSLLCNFVNQAGRVLVFSHTAPRSGVLGLRVRNQEDNKVPMKPLGLEYFQLSKELAKARVAVEMYVIAKEVLASQELPTTHFLASHTGGSIHLYSPFVPENHSENLYYNVYGALTRKYVYDVNFTARFSNSLNVHSYGIGDAIHQTRDITLGAFDPQSSISINFQQQQKIQQSSASFVQFAIMFTTGDGQRIIRIINYRFQISNKIQVIHEACDPLTVANLLMRTVTHRMVRGDGIKAREDLIGRLISIVAEYVQEAGNKVKISSFMAHPNLAPAFAYIHSFINSKIFMNHLKVPVDYQILEALKINICGFFNFSNFFYPKLFSLGMEIYQANPVPGDIIQVEGDTQQGVVLPPSLSLTAGSITKQGIYLHWSSDYLLILVQAECPSETLIQLFNTDNWDQLEEMNALPQLQTAHNIRVGLMIQQIRRRTSKNNGIYLPLLIRTPKKKGPYNDLLNMVLKQDYFELKYFAFLDTIHRNVQNKIK